MPRAPPTVVVERVADAPDVGQPARATPGSAGFDLAAAEIVELVRDRVSLVRTGLRVRCPPGTFLEVRPRSGLSARGVLMVNAPGTIDRDYSGEVRVPLTYLFPGSYRIEVGDRIAQVRLVDDRPTRFRPGRVGAVRGRTGGFGSTGR
ncbi:MAG TPA: dUTP diphosphatase [Thermoplasmata archaeon]|nr:dUTP diphosphatase [Thermoplasmata archaeon]